MSQEILDVQAEVDAMSVCATAMDGLSGTAQDRVIRWLCSYLGLGEPWPPKPKPPAPVYRSGDT